MMIDFSRIKRPIFIFNPSKKGWLKALGLHHALISVGWILFFSLFNIGWFGAAWSAGWYGSREYGNGPYPPKTFEYMDFMAVVVVNILYFTLY